MNLTPAWVGYLSECGIEAQHWSTIGSPRAPDDEVMEWARSGGWVVFTNDLDFGSLLAKAGAVGPSVIQVRTQDVLPQAIGPRVVAVLRQHASEIELGALVVFDYGTLRPGAARAFEELSA